MVLTALNITLSMLKYIEKLRDRAIEPTRHANFGNKNIVVRIRKEEGSGHFGSNDNVDRLI